MEFIEQLKKEKEHLDDLIIKTVTFPNLIIYLISLETITSSSDIEDFILKYLNYQNPINMDVTNYLLNHLPVVNIQKLEDYNTLLNRLFNGFTILLINQDILAIESRINLTRGVGEADYEKTILGPKDAFIEHYNTNLGLIRRRIKDSNLYVKTYELGRYTKTKVGLLYINGICKKDLIQKVDQKLATINIDGIIDSNSLKRYLNTSKNFFPTLKSTERPDLASMALLEGKVLVLADNSPEVLILPTFFIDYFHASDDYYQKQGNITFIRFVRFIAFLLSIFLPAIYISLTTHNPDNMPIKLLLSFQSQRQNVPFPAFIEAIIMILCFEILRETDVRIPSSMGTAISILGGIVLGDAAVSAGIVSPIMIIVVAISAISGMLMQSIEAVNSIRWYRFLFILLSSIFGFYGIFLGSILILTNLSNTKSLDKDYLYPFAPMNLEEQRDGILKLQKKIKYRNPLLSNNKKRGS